MEVRERFALGFEDANAVLAELRATGDVVEAVWLVTCNRVELYAVVLEDGTSLEEGAGAAGVEKLWDPHERRMRGHRARRGFGRLLAHFFGRPGMSDGALVKALYFAESRGVLNHLFRVAAGLDSMVPGETEILGQLKEAYELSRRDGHTGKVLNTLFQAAFRAAKQARSETGIQRGAVSVASLAAELAQEIFGDLTGCRVLVLGAGDTGEKVTRALLDRGVGDVRIASRSEERRQALAVALGQRARVAAVSDWQEILDTVDVVVGSTSAPGFVLSSEPMGPVMSARKGRPLLLLDLAVPRDFEPGLAAIPGIRLHNIDDLRSLAERHLERRHGEVGRCEALLRIHADEISERLERDLRGLASVIPLKTGHERPC